MAERRTEPSLYSSLDPLFSPRSVAVIGASENPARIGGRPISYMMSQGFAGTIFPVNDKRDRVQGLQAYRSIAALPMVPDAAVIAIPAAHAVRAVAEVALRGVKGAVVLSSGFAEVGHEGAAEQARMVAAARRSGMRILGPNCLGMYNARIGFFPTFTSSFEMGWPLPGRIGIVSQSGAYGAHLATIFRRRGLGVPVFVSTGNESDVSVGDAVGWMAEDPKIDIIALYIEGIRDADSFVGALDTARRARKPIIVLKVGSSARGKLAAQSHTASLAGDDAIFDAVLGEYAVARARTTEEMIDLAYMASFKKFPSPNTLGMLTISGGAGVIAADVAEASGLPMPEMPAEAQAHLKSIIPFATVTNPIDCTAQVLNNIDSVGAFAEAILDTGIYCSFLAFFTMVGGTSTAGAALLQQLRSIARRHPDRLFAISLVAAAERIAEYEDAGFAAFEDPSRAVKAIAAMGRLGCAFERPASAPLPDVRPFGLPPESPNEAEAKLILRDAGLATVPERFCMTAEMAVAAAEAFGYPVVLKVASADIRHKTEVGGVILDLQTAESVRDGFATVVERATCFQPNCRIDGVIVGRQIVDAVECAMGVHCDPVFGPTAMFGLGGIFIETIGDVVFRRCPFGEDVAHEMIRRIKGAPLLFGARGRKPVDVQALADMLARLSVLAVQAGPRLRSIDLNPVFAMPGGRGAFVADAIIDIAREPAEKNCAVGDEA